MWDQNYKHGFGVFTFQDGSQYIGRFHNDKMIEYNIYGFSIPNGIKPQNDRVSTANSKQGNTNKLKNTGAISRIGNQTNKPKEDQLSNETQKADKEEQKIKSFPGNISIKVSLDQNNNTNSNQANNNNKETNLNNNASSNLNNSNKDSLISANVNKPLGVNANNPNAIGNLEMISEQAELFNLSVIANENNKFGKENYFNNNFNNNNNNFNVNTTLLSNLDLLSQNINNSNNNNNNNNAEKKDKSKDNANGNNPNEQSRNNNLPNSYSNKEKKESEYNVFKTLIDITDLLECDPDIESNLREVENTMLRHLSEMKMWYRYYTNKDNQKDDNPSINASVMDDKISSKDLFSEKKTNHQARKDSSNKEVQFLKSISPNNAPNSSNLLEGTYSNDLAFAMELKDLWKFLRESNILTSEFSLAQFNRLFFKGPKNYIEMFMYPEDISSSNKIYDFIYFMISKSKDDFMTKYREKLLTTNITNNLFSGGYNNTSMTSTNHNNNNNFNNNNYNNNNYNNMITERNVFQDSNINDISNLKNNLEAESFNDNLHNKRQTILLRHFYEAILRSAYLRYAHINSPLHSKINNLIDTCIKTNINFKKVNRKSQMHTESSINSSVIVDMKVKSFERDLEFFLSNFEIRLKKSFKHLYFKSAVMIKKDDMTVTYRFFYDNIVKQSESLLALFDKQKFIELINIYHKDKIVFQENQKISRELFCYIENLLDMEFIFYEFCELVFFITRKLLQKNNLSESKDNFAKQISEIEGLIEQCDSVKGKDRFYYKFPKLRHHIAYENIIKTQKAKEEEERRRIQELKRIEFERNMMQVEDTNILPEFIEEDENEDDSSDYSNY